MANEATQAHRRDAYRQEKILWLEIAARALTLNASIFIKERGFIMHRHSLPIAIFVIVCGLLGHAAAAWAANETWVSGTGTDTGNCNITAPCKTFAYAYGFTNGGGTLNVLFSGNFGPLTIAKSISIVAQGVEAVISTAAGGAAIKVVGSADKIVSLRGLTIDLLGTNNIGINFVSGGALHVHDSVIRKATDGIRFAPASGTSELYVADSMIANTSLNGIEVNPTGSGGAKVVLDRVRVENSADAGIRFSGLSTTGSITATVRDSVSAGNAGFSILAGEASSGTTTVMIDRSAAVNNGTGIFASGAGATIRIGDSTVSGNNVNGLQTFNSGVIDSYGTNKVNGNGNDGAPTGPPIAMK
jgi:hypothetical protein